MPPTFVILIVCFASLALAEDFKTINGKIYKDATISSVEADGIVLKTKTGISRVFEIALVLVRFDHVARRIVNANHGIMRATALRRVSDCIYDRIRAAVPQATEWRSIGH